METPPINLGYKIQQITCILFPNPDGIPHTKNSHTKIQQMTKFIGECCADKKGPDTGANLEGTSI